MEPRLWNRKFSLFSLIVLIFDLGDGTLDASLLNIDPGMDIGAALLDVKAIVGDTHLGGLDFNNTMVSHFVRGFIKKHKKMDIRTNWKAMQRQQSACERVREKMEDV